MTQDELRRYLDEERDRLFGHFHDRWMAELELALQAGRVMVRLLVYLAVTMFVAGWHVLFGHGWWVAMHVEVGAVFVAVMTLYLFKRRRHLRRARAYEEAFLKGWLDVMRPMW